jgi:hypothetical protein
LAYNAANSHKPKPEKLRVYLRGKPISAGKSGQAHRHTAGWIICRQAPWCICRCIVKYPFLLHICTHPGSGRILQLRSNQLNGKEIIFANH